MLTSYFILPLSHALVLLITALQWRENEPNVTIKRKDCFHGCLGSAEEADLNVFIDWVKNYKIETVIFLQFQQEKT